MRLVKETVTQLSKGSTKPEISKITGKLIPTPSCNDGYQATITDQAVIIYITTPFPSKGVL